MSYFLKSGNTFRVSSQEAMDLHERLPAGNYIIKKDNFGTLFLERIDNFEFRGRRYGDLERNTERIFNTFQSRDCSTGVMLAGEKGSGKSLLAKSICIRAAAEGIPTIVINSPWHGEEFNQLIQDIDQPAVILFDEFEKVYDHDAQAAILTLLDGVFPTRKLFVLTCNDKYRVDTHMRNRPGRIYYMIDFKGLDHAFIEDYCRDNLLYPQHTHSICKLSSLFGEFNFDMLKAMVEEINRYNETPQQAMKLLNARPEFEENTKFAVSLAVDGREIPRAQLDSCEWWGNPLQATLRVDWDPDPGVDNCEWSRAEFAPSDLKELNSAAGRFRFVNAQGQQLVLTRAREVPFDYFTAF